MAGDSPVAGPGFALDKGVLRRGCQPGGGALRRQGGQRSSTRERAARMRWGSSGRLGRGGGPGWGGPPALFPPEPQVLQEGEGELAQERVVVQPAPAPPLEVAQP